MKHKKMVVIGIRIINRFLLLALADEFYYLLTIRSAFYSEVDLMTDETKYLAYIDSSTKTLIA